MSKIVITAENREAAMKEASIRLGLPEEALDVEWSEEEEELLAGARPMVQLHASVRLEYVAEKVQECLAYLLEKMEILESKVEMVVDSNMVIAKIDSENAEVLIGHGGETLDALQHLIVRMAHLGGRDMPLILVDAADYRMSRLERLKKVTETLATMVEETGKEEDFDPMDSLDRKIIHTLLKGRDTVQTYSRGEGYARQVIIAPAD